MAAACQEKQLFSWCWIPLARCQQDILLPFQLWLLNPSESNVTSCKQQLAPSSKNGLMSEPQNGGPNAQQKPEPTQRTSPVWINQEETYGLVINTWVFDALAAECQNDHPHESWGVKWQAGS